MTEDGIGEVVDACADEGCSPTRFVATNNSGVYTDAARESVIAKATSKGVSTHIADE